MIEPEPLLGPLSSVNKLLAMYIAAEAVPNGGSYLDGVRFILDEDARKKGVKVAKRKMAEAIAVIRSMPGYEEKTDEEIAKILVEKISERKREGRRS
jgi:hypothetical protein